MLRRIARIGAVGPSSLLDLVSCSSISSFIAMLEGIAKRDNHFDKHFSDLLVVFDILNGTEYYKCYTFYFLINSLVSSRQTKAPWI